MRDFMPCKGCDEPEACEIEGRCLEPAPEVVAFRIRTLNPLREWRYFDVGTVVMSGEDEEVEFLTRAPRVVRTCLMEGGTMAKKTIDIDALRERIAALGYHDSASHITHDYRDGFNRAIEEACRLADEAAATDTPS